MHRHSYHCPYCNGRLFDVVCYSCIIEAEFINGVVIKNETERGDENGNST